MGDLEKGTRGVCRHCDGSLIWWRSDEMVDRFHDGFLVRRQSNTRWYHLNPDPNAPNAEQNITVDSEKGPLGIGCPQREGKIAGRQGEPREFCAEYSRKQSGTVNICNNPVIDPEFMMCGVHLKRVQEDQAQIERRRESNEYRRALEEGLREQSNRIYSNWGIKVEPNQGYWGQGKVSVDPTDLEDLLEHLAAGKKPQKPKKEKVDAEAQG